MSFSEELGLEDLPPEIHIIIFSFLEVNETVKKTMVVCKEFHRSCESYHYWKIISERFFEENFTSEYTLAELHKEFDDWKEVYKYLLENQYFFDPESIGKGRESMLELTEKNKVVYHKNASPGGWPAIFLNRRLLHDSVFAISLKRSAIGTYSNSPWVFVGMCNEESLDYFKQGKDYFGAGKDSIGFYWSDFVFYESGRTETIAVDSSKSKFNRMCTLTFKFDVPKKQIKLFYEGKYVYTKKMTCKIQPPIHVGIHFPMYCGQIMTIVKNPDLKE